MTEPSSLNAWVHCLSHVVDTGLLLIGEDGGLSLANRKAQRLLRRDVEELRRDWPELRDHIAEQASEALWTHGSQEIEADLPVAGGTRGFLLEVVPVEEDDCQGHLVQIRDLEEVRRADRDLLLASQMHSISRLYRSMAHDLRSPLNAMVVNLELLGDAVKPGADKPGLPERRQRYVRVLKEEMERLNRLLQALLTQTSPATDGRRRFDLAAMVRDIAGFIEPQARKQSTEVELELPGEAVESHGQADQVRSAILSMVVNGLQAVEDLDEGHLQLGVAAENGEAVVWVSDDGAGVPQELVQQIFELHYTTRASGSGIGLHVARLVAERHGGSLELEDNGGTGARFELRLPRWTVDPQEEH